MKTEEELSKLSDYELKTILSQMLKDGNKPSPDSVLGKALDRFIHERNMKMIELLFAKRKRVKWSDLIRKGN